MAIKLSNTVFTTVEAAKRMHLSEHTVRAYIERGILKATKMGPIWLLTSEECDRYNKERRPRGRPDLVKTA